MNEQRQYIHKLKRMMLFLHTCLLVISIWLIDGLPCNAEESATFYGAAGTISGSCIKVDTGKEQLLLDCGAFMEKSMLKFNDTFPFRPSSISLVALSHAHLDHNGKLPLLTAKGFSGPILCAPGTKAISKIMLDIQEKIRADETGIRSSVARLDIDSVINQMHEAPYLEPYKLDSGTEVTLFPAEHILGSAMTQVAYGSEQSRKTLIFTGDFGNNDGSLFQPKAVFTKANTVIIESTYGDRDHPANDQEMEKFFGLLEETAQDGGIVLVPAFVLARTQKVVATIFQAMESGQVPWDLNVYVDSPSAKAITKIYAEHEELLADSVKNLSSEGYSAFNYRSLKYPRAINQIKRPAVIIGAAASLEGGRMRKYLQRFGEKEDTRICFVSSYQEPGSIADKLVKGVREIDVDGQRLRIRAQVFTFSSFSAHGDRKQILEWLKHFTHIDQVFVVHGEKKSSQHLAERIHELYGWKTIVPELNQTYKLP